MSFHTPLDLACDPTRTADVAAIVMQEGAVHYHCAVFQFGTYNLFNALYQNYGK